MSSNSSPEIRLVVLDWAGTTVDFGCFAPVDSFAKALEAHGVVATDEQVRGPMGTGQARPSPGLAGGSPSWPSSGGPATAGPGMRSDVARIYRDDYVPLQMEAISGHDRLVPGLLPVVEALRSRGVKIATTTGYFREAAGGGCSTRRPGRGMLATSTSCPTRSRPAGRPPG